MKPIQTFIRGNGIHTIVFADKVICKLTDAKHPRRYTPGRIEIAKTGTDVKKIYEDEDSSLIAKFNPDGTVSDEDFVILATTDFHFEDDIALRDKTYSMLMKQIRDVKPDLVVFTGDVIESNHQQIDAVRFAQMMEEVGVYWAYVFGNHEAREEKEYHKYFLLKNLSQYEHCLSKIGKKELFGYGNFFVNIAGSDGKVRQSLVFFDSGRNISPKYRFENGLESSLSGYDYIKNNQKKWYADKIRELQKNNAEVKSMMFMHIPIKEYENVFTLDPEGKYVPSGKAEILYGGQYESVGSSPVNSGLFSLIKELGSTQAVFSGHDHVNDFCAEYDGIKLVYVQCGGYETYTLGDICGFEEKDWVQGVTVIKVKKDGSADIGQRFNRDYL